MIVASNLMAMLIQTLSAKLGIATGRNLPEVCRERFSHRTSVGLWVQAEIIAMATDLAEFLGAAIGFHLLFGIGLFPAAVITGITTFAILGLQNFGFRPFEAVIIGFVGVISVCYIAELWYAHPPLGTVAKHAVVPQFNGSESLLLAVGILGATVMPHVIYLHSALMQDRIVPRDEREAKKLFRYTKIDVIIAMSIAGIINISMLVVAAAVFYNSGLLNVASLETAHRTLEPLLGGASSQLFALALIASGLSSSTVGTLAGQVVMQGFIRRQIPIWVRRTVTMLPAFVVIAIGVDPSRTLIISQVVLSFGIPFALIPLVMVHEQRARRDGRPRRPGRVTTAIAASRRAGEIVPATVRTMLQRASTQTFHDGRTHLLINGLEVAERIDRHAVDAHLEVQVRPEAVAGAADVADDLALRDRGAVRDGDTTTGVRTRSRGRCRGRSP